MLTVEISYMTEGEELPEHEGYYTSAEEAKQAIDDLFSQIEEGE